MAVDPPPHLVGEQDGREELPGRPRDGLTHQPETPRRRRRNGERLIDLEARLAQAGLSSTWKVAAEGIRSCEAAAAKSETVIASSSTVYTPASSGLGSRAKVVSYTPGSRSASRGPLSVENTSTPSRVETRQRTV